jgi:APA family basic amino acid/polyamine antiporter
MISLPSATLIRFVAWNLLGLVVYLAYSRRTSLLARGVDTPPVREASVMAE